MYVDGAPDGLSLLNDPHGALPWSGPEDVGVGHALITMVEPHRENLREYNRWFEDNHYFDGAMQMPWMYSGRRFVATLCTAAPTCRRPASASSTRRPAWSCRSLTHLSRSDVTNSSAGC